MHKITSVAYLVLLPNQSSKCMTYLLLKHTIETYINFKTKLYNEGKLTKVLRCRPIYCIGPKLYITYFQHRVLCRHRKSTTVIQTHRDAVQTPLQGTATLTDIAMQLLLHLGEHLTRSRILSWLISGLKF